MLVLALLGILVGMAAPIFWGLLTRYRLTVTQDEIYQAIRQTQRNAMQQRVEWQFSIREQDDRVQWASHPKSLELDQVNQWNSLQRDVDLDEANTTLAQKSDTYYVRFNDRGTVTYRLGRVTFASRNGSAARRCVIVSTLIGAMRQGQEHGIPDSSNKYCY